MQQSQRDAAGRAAIRRDERILDGARGPVRTSPTPLLSRSPYLVGVSRAPSMAAWIITNSPTLSMVRRPTS
jgi:hypothetical protein